MTSANRKLALHAVPGLVFVPGFAFGGLGLFGSGFRVCVGVLAWGFGLWVLLEHDCFLAFFWTKDERAGGGGIVRFWREGVGCRIGG